MSAEESEMSVREYLKGLGRGECAVRVIQAMPSLSADHSSWVNELQAMELEGELDAFLDACAPDATPDATPRVPDEDVAVLKAFYAKFQPEFAEDAKCREVLGYYLNKGAEDADWRDALRSEYKKERSVDPWEWYESTQSDASVLPPSDLSVGVSSVNSTPRASPRGGDDLDESIGAAVELAAEVALESGSIAEEMFTVTGAVKGKKKPRELQLKVGQMSLQLFEATSLLDSWRYPDLGGWEFAAEKGAATGKLMLKMGPNKKKGQEDLEFVCSDDVGTRCCMLMQEHAMVMYTEEKKIKLKQLDEQRKKKEATLLSLRGEYTVSAQCMLLRETQELDSSKVCIIEANEQVRVVDAIIVDGRTRVHVVADGVRVRNSSRSSGGVIEGWGSWKSSVGDKLLHERLRATQPTTPKAIPSTSTQKGLADGSGPMQYWLGSYVTEPTQAGGVLVRSGENLESEPLYTIATGECVEAVDAKFIGERLRLHVVSESTKLVDEKPGEPTSGAVDGWVSLRNSAGVGLLRKADSAEPAENLQEQSDSNSEQTGSENGNDEEDEDEDEDEFDAQNGMVSSLILEGSIQDQIDDALVETCQDLDGIKTVLQRAADQNYSHPALKALQMKAMSLEEQAHRDSGGKPASSSITQRRMSVAQEGVSNVVDLAGKAAAESGEAGEKMFSVTLSHSGKKLPQKVQLKVSQMGVQVFDGQQIVDSWLYANLSAWEFKAGKRLLVLVIAGASAGSGSPSPKPRAGAKRKTQEFGCTASDGARICKLMTEHATAMVKQKRSEMKQHLQELRGKYTVTTPNGVLMRAEASPDSFKIGIVARNEELEVVDALLTGGRTRLHAIGNNIHMDDGSRQDVDGWVSLKSGNGTPFMVKTDQLIDGHAPPTITPPEFNAQNGSLPKPSRLQNLRRHSVAIGSGVPSGHISPRANAAKQARAKSPPSSSSLAIVEYKVKQTHIKRAAEQVTLRCEPLALRVMDGSHCVSSYTYQSLAEWQIITHPTPDEPKQLQLTLIKGGEVLFSCSNPGDAEKISLSMAQHAEKLSKEVKVTKSPQRERSRTTGTAQAMVSKRRASIAVGSGMGVMPLATTPKGRKKAFIKNSAFMSKSQDGEDSFIAKQKTPKLRDVTLMLHNFGLQLSVHLQGERPVTYTYDRIPSWKVLPNGDLSLKVVSPKGDLEIFNFATGDAERISGLLAKYSGAEPTTPTAAQQASVEEVVEPGDRYECIEACPLTAEWERKSEKTGHVVVGQVIEVAEATINFQKQWRAKVSRAWDGNECAVLVPHLEGGWVSLQTVNGVSSFLPVGGEKKEAAQAPQAAQDTESAFWRETRLLEEATQRAREAGSSGDDSKAAVEPVQVTKKMRKSSKSSTKRPSETSETSAAPSIPDSQELDDPVSPRFLQDAASAAGAEAWPADEKLRLQEQHATELAEQQRRIASLEMQIVDLNRQVETEPGAPQQSTPPDGVQAELVAAKQQATTAVQEKDKVEQEKVVIEKRALEQLAKMHLLEERVKLLDSQVKSDGSNPPGDELGVGFDAAAEAMKRAEAAESKAEYAEGRLAELEQQNQQLQTNVSEQQRQLQFIERQQLVQAGDAERIVELETVRASNERDLQALSEELDHATTAMGVFHEESEAAHARLLQLSEAHDSVVAQVTTLKAQKGQLEMRVADQVHQVRDFEAQMRELEQLRVQRQMTQDQDQSESLRKLEAQVSSLNAKAVDGQAAQDALRRANADLKIQLQTAQATSVSARVASGDSSLEELRAAQAKAHETALEVEVLRTEVARATRFVAEAEGREAKAIAEAADARGRTGLVTQELQTTKDELQLQRSVVTQLNEQVATAAAAVVTPADSLEAGQELDVLRVEHKSVQEKLQAEMALRKGVEDKVESLGREVTVGTEARKRLEDEARAGWEKADVEAGLRKEADDEKRAKISEAQAKVDELTRALKKQQALLDTEMQRHDDAQRKVKAEVERSHAAELNAQHVASRARAASTEMRSNLIDIQSKYEKQLAAVRVEKAKVEGARDQAIEERQRLQEWVHEHMEATQERLLNSSAAVEAAEKARVELQPRLDKSEAEVRRLKDQLRRVARESASAQQQAASQLEHLQAVSQAEQMRLKAQLAETSNELEEQCKKAALEKDRREVSERRVESDLEAARLSERNASHAIEDARAELDTALQQAELDIARRHREEIETLRLEKARLEGQFEHSVRQAAAILAAVLRDCVLAWLCACFLLSASQYACVRRYKRRASCVRGSRSSRRSS
jgi:hypothetical protein